MRKLVPATDAVTGSAVFDIRLETVYLSVLKIRQGGYIPFFVTEKKRSEKALIQVVLVPGENNHFEPGKKRQFQSK